jgi:hypothetical protein
MDDTEREEPLDDFTVEITDLDEAGGQGRRRWPHLTPRQRRLSVAATAALFVLIIGMLLGSGGGTRGLLGSVFSRPASTPDPSMLTGSMAIYLRGNPTWGHFTLDGRALAHTPVIGYDQPLTLARGLHTLIWQAQPFKSKTCVFTVTDATTAKGPCFSTNEITASFEPGVEAMVIAFFASLNDLPANQRAVLTQQLQTQFADYNSSSQVQPGELYAVSEQDAQANPALCRPFESLALCYARADQPLSATLSLQVDNMTTSNDPCVTTNQCDSYRQDCRALCEDPVVDYSQQKISGWSVDAVVGLLWSYRTLAGQEIASAEPDTAIRGAQTYRLVSVHLDHSAQDDWQITLFPTYGSVSDNPVCAQATADTMSILGASFDNNSNIYVRQSASSLTQMALGCLTIAAPADAVAGVKPTPIPTADAIQPASFLLRFGVPLAVNASAHKICPNLPVADTGEKNIAQQLLAVSSATT